MPGPVPHASDPAHEARGRRRLAVVAALLVGMLGLLGLPSVAEAAMEIKSGPRVAVNPHQVTIWWHSSSSGSSELRWDTANRGDFANFANDVSNTATDLGTVHSRTISNLPAGSYVFRVRTTGADGVATSGAHRFEVREPNAATPLGSTVTNGTINDILHDPNGTRTYVAGSFSQIGERLGSGIEVSNDSAALQPGTPHVAGSVKASAADSTGGLYLVGWFDRVGGLVRPGIVRLLPDGGVDPYFSTSGSRPSLEAVAVSGTSVYVAGFFTSIGGVSRPKLAALDARTGAVLSQFNPPGTGPNSTVLSLAVEGSRLYLGGYFTSYDGVARNYLAAVDSGTGALDTGFAPGSGPNGGVRVLTTTNSLLYIGGEFTSYAGVARGRVAAVDLATAALDGTFNPAGASGEVRALRVADARLYVGGSFLSFNGVSIRSLAVVSSTTGVLDAGFDHGSGTSGVNDFAIVGSKLYIGGGFSTYKGTPRSNVAAVDKATGALDPAFDAGLGFNREVMTLDPTGSRIHVGGWFTTYRGAARNHLAALHTVTGALDTTFTPAPGGSITSLVRSGSRLYIGGYFISVSGTTRNRIAALDAVTGALDTGFSPPGGANSAVEVIHVDGTRLYLGGSFSTVNGTSRSRIAALDLTTGALDTGFDPGSGPSDTVFALASAGARLYVGGQFTTYNGAARGRIAAVDLATAQLDAGFATGSGAGATVRALLPSGTRLFAAGAFTSYDGTTRNQVAALDAATGGLDAGFNVGSGIGGGGTLYGMAEGGGRLYLVGNMQNFSGYSRDGLAAVAAATGAVDTAFSPGTGTGSREDVKALALAGTRLWFGGNFQRFNNVSQGSYGIYAAPASTTPESGTLSISTAPQHSVSPYQTTVWWSTTVSASSELVWDNQRRASFDDYENGVSNRATNLGTLHSRTIANLPAGTYYYRVRSRTAGGEQRTSGEYSFTVQPPDAATPLGSTVVGPGAVYSTVASGARLYLGGEFTQVGTRLGSGIELDAASAAVRGSSPQVAGQIFASIPDGSGGWYIAGDFTRVGGLSRGRVAHLLPDGGVDPGFGAGLGANNQVNALALSGGKLYLGGNFSTYDGTSRNYIAAVDATTGALDTGFNPGTGANSNVNALATSGTRLYLGGLFTTYNGTSRVRVAAVDAATGALDTGFNPGTGAGANNVVRALAVSGSRLYLGGDFSFYNGTSREGIAAADTVTGALDTGFDPGTGANGDVHALAINSSRLYLGGNFTIYNGTSRIRVAAVNTTTAALDTGFDPGTGPDAYVSALALSGTRLHLGGNFTLYNGAARNYVAAVDGVTAGLDTGFNPGTGANSRVSALAADGTGRLYLGGAFTGYKGTRRNRIAALDASTGALDTGFDPGTGVNSYVNAMAISAGKLYLGGTFSTYNGTSRVRVAAVDAATGALDTGFSPGTGPNSDVMAIAVAGGRLYLGGWFTSYDGTARNRIAAVSATTGGLDTGFTPGTGTNANVNALTISGSKLYLGGNFTSYNGTTRGRVAAVDATTGALDTLFVPATGASGDVKALVVDGSRLYLGGYFTSYDGTARNRIAAVDATTGALDIGFDPGTGADAGVLALSISGTRLYLGGSFGSYNATARMRLAAVDTVSAALDTTFSPTGGAASTGTVSALAAAGSRLHVGGSFISYNGISQGGFAMFDTCDRTGFCADELLRDYVSVGVSSATVPLGAASSDTSATGTIDAIVRTNAINGYSLTATDASDSASLGCSSGNCAGYSIPDWSGAPATPSTWAESGTNYGFGVTVLSSTLAAKPTAWGLGTTATDFAQNRYAGLRSTTAAVLQRTDRYLADTADTTRIGLRARVSPTQRAGSYSGTISITALANP